MSITEIAPMDDAPATTTAPVEDQSEDAIMTDEPNVATTNSDNATNDMKAEASPLPEASKSHFPAELASLIPHTPRSAKDQETYTHRKIEIMRKLTLAEIQTLYEAETEKVLKMLEDDRRHNDEVKKQIEILEKQRGLERKIYSDRWGAKVKDKEEDGKKDDGMAFEQGSAKGEEGEVLEDGEDVKMEGGE